MSKCLSIRARAPTASTPLVRRIMQAVPVRDTAPEVVLRRALFRAGLRFRKDCRPEADYRCKADIVFPRQCVCIFVDGCFWHGCSQHFRCPKANATWWREKIEDNRVRDRTKSSWLRAKGWRVIRVFEHAVWSRASLRRVMEGVVRAVR
jgi:DNA mismatch endonuclease (patch repair protein)